VTGITGLANGVELPGVFSGAPTDLINKSPGGGSKVECYQ
jgi:hypothetical protein